MDQICLDLQDKLPPTPHPSDTLSTKHPTPTGQKSACGPLLLRIISGTAFVHSWRPRKTVTTTWRRSWELWFGRRDHPSTVQQKLGELRQGKEPTEEYDEQVRQLVTWACPDLLVATQEELAAEAFLRGYKNPRVAYQAMNSNPQTLASAWELIDAYEHNYKATMGRDLEPATRGHARMVTWASDEEIGEVRGVANTPPPPTQSDLDRLQVEFCSDLESLRDQLEKLVQVSQESRDMSNKKNSPGASGTWSPHALSPGPLNWVPTMRRTSSKCYGCGKVGHFKRDCSCSPSPAPQQ